MVLVVKNPPANAGDIRDTGLIPGLGISPVGEHGNPLQYSCRENLMDRGVFRLQSIVSLRNNRSDIACTHAHRDRQQTYDKKNEGVV